MENLTITEIQGRCDALAKAMGEKGLRGPSAQLDIISGGSLDIIMRWHDMEDLYQDGIKVFVGVPDFNAAAAFIAALPDPATEGERKFTRALADAVDIATEYALDDKLVAPVKVAIAQVNDALLAAPK